MKLETVLWSMFGLALFVACGLMQTDYLWDIFDIGAIGAALVVLGAPLMDILSGN